MYYAILLWVKTWLFCCGLIIRHFDVGVWGFNPQSFEGFRREKKDFRISGREVAIMAQLEVAIMAQLEVAIMAQLDVAIMAQLEVAIMAQLEVAIMAEVEVAIMAQLAERWTDWRRGASSNNNKKWDLHHHCCLVLVCKGDIFSLLC
jgi:hypothetical protein